MDRADYENIAKEATEQFLSSGESLEDSIVKIAQRDRLNPEQIKRVVELANTGAFLELFKKTSGYDDRMVEFAVADPTGAIKKFYAESDSVPAVETSNDVYFDDVKEAALLEKVAEYEYLGEPDSVLERRRIREIERKVIRDRKVAESLHTKIAAAEYQAESLADGLAHRFSNIYSRERHPEFEKNALALYGPEAVYALSAVRKRLKLPDITRMPSVSVVKTASAHFLVDGSAEGMADVGAYLECVGNFRTYTTGLKALNAEAQ
tara:strand:- start:128 stop:919 length:792 start_codon:yes stop_codon:yes gene_type:complete